MLVQRWNSVQLLLVCGWMNASLQGLVSLWNWVPLRDWADMEDAWNFRVFLSCC
jgi:hypothetical protein